MTKCWEMPSIGFDNLNVPASAPRNSVTTPQLRGGTRVVLMDKGSVYPALRLGHPGRKNGTATAEEIDFSSFGGTAA
jgi:hypothetical protein